MTDLFWRGICFFGGVGAAVSLGMSNGRELGEAQRLNEEACVTRAAAAYDAALLRVESASAVTRDAIFALGERCVLLPGSERLTVARAKAVTP